MRLRSNLVIIACIASTARSEETCDPACVNGQCTGTNQCACYTGWSGSDCSTPDNAGTICGTSPNLIVDPSSGEVNNYSTLADALAVAQPGDLILVKNGNYAVSSTIEVTVSGVTICGESQEGTVFATAGDGSDPAWMLNIRADNVRIARLRMEHKASDENGSAISVSDPGDVDHRYKRFMMDSVTLVFNSCGVSIRADDWSVSNSFLACNSDCLNKDGTAIKSFGSVGVNSMRANKMATDVIYSQIRPITLTESLSATNDYVEGQLLIRSNELVTNGWKTPSQMQFGFENFNRKGDSQLEIVFEHNKVLASQWGALYFNPGVTLRKNNGGDAIKSLTMGGNDFSSPTPGHCIMFLFAIAEFSFRSIGALPILISQENTVLKSSGQAAGFQMPYQVPGSTRGEVCYGSWEGPSQEMLAEAAVDISEPSNGSTEVCKGDLITDSAWYWALNECAVGQSDTVTASSLLTCLESRNSDFFPDWHAWNFLFQSADCLQCAVSFAESARIRLQETDPYFKPIFMQPQTTNCPATAGNPRTSWEDRSCQRVLYYQIEDMNVCMANGKNIATGLDNYRCSVQQDIEIQSRYEFYSSMAAAIAAGTYTLENYWSAFGKISTAGDFNIFIQDYPCKPCFDDWFTDYRAIGRTRAFDKLQKCYGTYPLNGYLVELTEDQKTLYLDYYPSYYLLRPLLAANLVELSSRVAYLENRTGIPFSSDLPPYSAWGVMANAMASECEGISEFSTECTSKLSQVGFLTTARYFQAFYRKNLRLENPRCSAEDFSRIKAAVAVKDVVLLGLSSASELEAAENVVTKLIPDDLKTLPCVSCYRVLAGLSFRYSSDMGMCLQDMSGKECTEALNAPGRPMYAFRQCVTLPTRDLQVNEELNAQLCTPSCPTMTDLDDPSKLLSIAQSVIRDLTITSAPEQLQSIFSATDMSSLSPDTQSDLKRISNIAVMYDASSALHVSRLLLTPPETLTPAEQNVVKVARSVDPTTDVDEFGVFATIALGDSVRMNSNSEGLFSIVNLVTDGSFAVATAANLLSLCTGNYDVNINLLSNVDNLLQGANLAQENAAYGFVDVLNGASSNTVLDLVSKVALNYSLDPNAIPSVRTAIMDGRKADENTLTQMLLSGTPLSAAESQMLANLMFAGYAVQNTQSKVINALAFVTTSN